MLRFKLNVVEHKRVRRGPRGKGGRGVVVLMGCHWLANAHPTLAAVDQSQHEVLRDEVNDGLLGAGCAWTHHAEHHPCTSGSLVMRLLDHSCLADL